MRTIKDEFLHKGLRNKLVIQLREKGIKDENVLYTRSYCTYIIVHKSFGINWAKVKK